MNGAHLHLVLNHFPVAGSLLAGLLLAYAIWKKNDAVRQTALGGLVLIALFGLAAYFTGEGAEHIAVDLQGVSKERIEEHEEAALPALILLELSGAMALAGLVGFRGKKKVPSALLVATLAAVFLSAGMLARTANLGGLIRHPEIEQQGPAPGHDHSKHEHGHD